MSVWSAKRQLTYIGIFLLIIIIAIGFFVMRLLSVDPTCFDGRQNGDETSVDAGGSCQIEDPEEVLGLVPLWARPFKIADSVYTVTAYFENQNRESGVYNIPYRFRVYDNENVIITERRGETFIGPNQNSAVVETAIQTGNRIPFEVFFEFDQEPVWLEAPEKFSRSQITVTEQNLEDTEAGPRLDMKLFNRGLDDLSDVEIIVILYDIEGNAITASKTVIDKFISTTTETVVFTWPETFDRPVVEIEMIPRFNVFTQGQ